jgi:hypothetical protein
MGDSLKQDEEIIGNNHVILARVMALLAPLEH